MQRLFIHLAVGAGTQRAGSVSARTVCFRLVVSRLRNMGIHVNRQQATQQTCRGRHAYIWFAIQSNNKCKTHLPNHRLMGVVMLCRAHVAQMCPPIWDG